MMELACFLYTSKLIITCSIDFCFRMPTSSHVLGRGGSSRVCVCGFLVGIHCTKRFSSSALNDELPKISNEAFGESCTIQGAHVVRCSGRSVVYVCVQHAIVAWSDDDKVHR